MTPHSAKGTFRALESGPLQSTPPVGAELIRRTPPIVLSERLVPQFATVGLAGGVWDKDVNVGVKDKVRLTLDPHGGFKNAPRCGASPASRSDGAKVAVGLRPTGAKPPQPARRGSDARTTRVTPVQASLRDAPGRCSRLPWAAGPRLPSPHRYAMPDSLRTSALAGAFLNLPCSSSAESRVRGVAGDVPEVPGRGASFRSRLAPRIDEYPGSGTQAKPGGH